MPQPNSPGASSTSSATPPPVTMSSTLARTPTAQPATNARGTPRRPPKLRSSCDACGAAKVRCDKTQPRCGRCVAGGLNCVYGLSRKFGKAPRKKPQIDTNAAVETIPRPLAQGTQQNTISCCTDYHHLSGASRPIKYEPTPVSSYGLQESLMAMPSVYPTHDIFLRSPTTMDAFDDPFSFTDSPVSMAPDHRATVDPLDLSYPSADFQSFGDWVHPDELMHTPPSSSDIESAPSLSSSRASSLDVYHGISDASLMAADSHNCHQLAYSTLESLTSRQEGLGLSKSEPLVQTMDKVLNRNKQAVNNMHQLLKCSCSKSPHMVMLYASITSKILMWYQLAAGCTKPTTSWDYFSSNSHQPTPPLSNTSSPSMAFMQPSSPSVPTSQFVVTPMRFSVGAFSVDDESAQQALQKQLLLSEIKKAGNLIELLTIHGRDELATGEVNEIYSALGTWLKCELSRTIATLKS